MKLKSLIFLIFITCQFSMVAQEEEPQPEPYLKYSLITVNLTSPVLSFVPRWGVGYYRSLNDRFIAGAEFGYGSSGTIIRQSKEPNFKMNYRAWEVRPELFYVIKQHDKAMVFISSEFYFIHHIESFENEKYYLSSTDRFYSYDSADYEREKYGVNINFGFNAPFNKTFGFLFKVGAGVKVRNVMYHNISNPRAIYFETESFIPSATNYISNVGIHTGFNVNLDFKFYINLN